MSLLSPLVIIFSVISLGIICGKKKLFSHDQIDGFELFLMKISLPCYLFTSTLHHPFFELINFPYIKSYFLSVAILVSVAILYFLWRSVSNITIKILTVSYVNSGFYGVPILTFLLNDPKAAILSNLMQIILIQSIAVMLLGLIHHREKSVAHRLFITFTSPLFFMPVTGLAFNYWQITPPHIIHAITQSLGSSASSMALFAFGLSLSTVELKRKNLSKELMFIVCAKNILHPVIAFIVGSCFFSLEAYWFASLVIISSAPTAFIVYLLAKQFNADKDVVKLAVATSSIGSLIMLVVISMIFGQ